MILSIQKLRKGNPNLDEHKTFCGIWYCNKDTVYSLYQSFLGATNGEKVVGTIVYFIIYSIHNSKGPMEPRGQGQGVP